MKTLKEYFKERLLSQLNEKDYYQNRIDDRNTKPTMGIDPGTNEVVLRGSPMDINAHGPLSVAKTYRRYYESPKENFKDPLNMNNINHFARLQKDEIEGVGGQLRMTHDKLNRQDRDRQLFGKYGDGKPDPVG